MPKTINSVDLVRAGACQQARKKFADLLGARVCVTVTQSLMIKHASDFDFSWGSRLIDDDELRGGFLADVADLRDRLGVRRSALWVRMKAMYMAKPRRTDQIVALMARETRLVKAFDKSVARLWAIAYRASPRPTP